MATSYKKTPIDIMIIAGDPQQGNFPGLHWEQVAQHPVTNVWIPFRKRKWLMGPHESIAACVREAERSVDDGYVRYIIVGENEIQFGPIDVPFGEQIH